MRTMLAGRGLTAHWLRGPEGHVPALQRLVRAISAVVLVTGIVATVCHADDQHASSDTRRSSEASVQTECPVMVGNKIDRDIYTDYKGKRVFFCCQICKSSFLKNPGKYLPRLPQFTFAETASGHEGHEGHNHAHEFSLAGLVEPTGILTLSLVALTVCLGVLRRVRRLKPRLLLKLHKLVGVCALCSGVVHATIVLLTH